MDELERGLAKHQVVGLDTSIFIYHLEKHSLYYPLTTIILEKIEAGTLRAVLSTVTIMELTVHPWRRGKPDVARKYEAMLAHFPNLELADVTREVARHAAQLRAAYNVRPAAALLAATALTNQATAYVTNDKGLSRLEELLAVFLLDSFGG